MKPDDRIGLRHIVDALNSTIRFTAGRRRGDLDEDEMPAFAWSMLSRLSARLAVGSISFLRNGSVRKSAYGVYLQLA